MENGGGVDDRDLDEVMGMLPRLLSMLQPPTYIADHRPDCMLRGGGFPCTCPGQPPADAERHGRDCAHRGYGLLLDGGHNCWANGGDRRPVRVYGNCACGNWTPRESAEILAALPTPDDEKVREAVRHAECVLTANPLGPHIVVINEPMLRTLLSHVRAAQSPGLTEEMSEVMEWAKGRCDACALMQHDLPSRYVKGCATCNEGRNWMPAWKKEAPNE